MDPQAQGNPIRLVLVDDQALFRTSLSRFLAMQPGLEVVAECATATEALEILHGSPVDIVLLDLDLRTNRGDGLIPASRNAGFEGRFLIIAEAVDTKGMAGALKLGVSGIFLKSEAPDRLVQAVRLIATGAVWIDHKVIHLLADRSDERSQLGDRRSGNRLTEREERVLLGILGGLTSRKIGDTTGLSESTVKSVVQQLFVRAGVRKRSQLVRAALEGSLGAANELSEPVRIATMTAAPAGSCEPVRPAPEALPGQAPWRERQDPGPQRE
jgi:DNA-binding NarL/FixJ family response regulator